MRRRLPTFIKFVHKLIVLERFSFTRVTRVDMGCSDYTGGYCILYRNWNGTDVDAWIKLYGAVTLMLKMIPLSMITKLIYFKCVRKRHHRDGAYSSIVKFPIEQWNGKESDCALHLHRVSLFNLKPDVSSNLITHSRARAWLDGLIFLCEIEYFVGFVINSDCIGYSFIFFEVSSVNEQVNEVERSNRGISQGFNRKDLDRLISWPIKWPYCHKIPCYLMIIEIAFSY